MSLLPVAVIPSSGYNLTNSLRFRSSATAFLSRTPATAGSRTTWTWSGWVKRGALGTEQFLFTGGNTNYNDCNIRFNSADILVFNNFNGVGADAGLLSTARVFRDPSAWYHIVAVWNTTTATANDRMQLWVNGVRETAFTSNVAPSQNQISEDINLNVIHNIGRKANGATAYFDGYMTEINFIDGQALSATSFGETNAATGVWQPIKYTGTYGTNGFYLNFSSIALTSGSNTGLGQDFSGNGNFWNTNNISVTAGVTYDAMLDVPTLTSSTVSNYCTLNPLSTFWNTSNFQAGVPSPAATISNGNLTYSRVAAAAPNSIQIYACTHAVSSGKWYWEWVASSQYSEINAGIMDDNLNLYGFDNGRTATVTYNTNMVVGSTIFTGANGNIYGMAFDADAGTLYIYENNVLKITTTGIPTGRTWRPTFGDTASTGTTTADINFGQRPFTYTPPTGYNRINTFNLPNSTIVKGNTVMDATTYTGTGASRSVTNAAGFRPDFVWVKQRSGTNYHALYDSIRGVQRVLQSNTTSAEITQTDALSSFNSNGYSWLTNADGNGNGSTYVAWQWQAGQGSTSSNTSGSITSTVSVNATAGFSIVTYTGNGSASQTVGHGLGVDPKMLIVKARNSTGDNWAVWHNSFSATQVIYLELTSGVSIDAPTTWSALPTSTTFSVNSTNHNSNESGVNYVAYLWAEIQGFSKFGSYIGNGNANGPFVYTGFRPKFFMIKRTNTTGNWKVHDTSRDILNVTGNTLYPNAASNEVGSDSLFDMLSNGIKLRDTNIDTNASGSTYIYAAFAENPFKNSLAR